MPQLLLLNTTGSAPLVQCCLQPPAALLAGRGAVRNAWNLAAAQVFEEVQAVCGSHGNNVRLTKLESS